MFTGIIEGQGTITGIRSSGEGKELTVAADFNLSGSKIGDSIAVNGACLTAVSISDRQFKADVSPETLLKTTFGKAGVGTRVNLERALRLSDRIDGHLVSGHIDGTGVIRNRISRSNAVIITFGVPAALSRYMIPKGSVAVDGISLTINQCGADFFEVSIIPHTAGLTTVGMKKTGEPVNIETDMIGKYVERFVTGQHGNTGASNTESGGMTLDFLRKNGFL